MPDNIDQEVEQKALREHGFIGRGGGMGNALFAIDYAHLPAEAIHTIQLIINGGPFPYPHKDGTSFGNKFEDLPTGGDYLEFTVPTPGVSNRGARRIVARKSGVLFFTACHYERVQGLKGEARVAATAAIDAEWRNGFYVVTGMSADLRQSIKAAIAKMHAAP